MPGAALGQKGRAVLAADESERAVPVSHDAWSGTARVFAAAEVYAMVGQYDRALERLEWLLSVPSWASVGLLRADPLWDPLRNHPRFKALLAKYGNASSS